ncbi:Metal-dependent hydrolase, endonuclease/exonuclease/phosphatase family [Parapedobacter composti]|uniref:Metal-dependent hydrolase, endonuclease/exonuclease/phosphatase family n=1 Tax=Parapedobacter composti TaxID=623281 RepID=A0A1I1LLH9_9SPHI|nr:endonuclease/exonuclease/phosphatase family protein [Parapedobacter composti]SFC73796.1 Metal-dependent hydrolase, endonuclease/exonuclease/phosphatase family [Parapedobacter composti]
MSIRFFCVVIALWMAHSDVKGQSVDTAPIKLRVGVYNVGHFNQGSLGGFQESGDKARAELNNWRKWIGQQSMDIFAVNEWNRFFDKDSTFNSEEQLLNPYYNNVYFGAEHRWIYNGIATNYRLTNLRQQSWGGDYYALIGDLELGGKTITVMCTHIPWQKQWHEAALDSMISEMKKYEYLICMGDMNAFDGEQLRFQEQGFNIANGGYMGWFCTAPTSRAIGRKDGFNIDNIITSPNIKIMNVSAPFTTLNDRDHLPVLADLIITNQ